MNSDGRLWQLTFAAWLVALLSTMAVLFIGEIMGQAPCVLCWFQRVFMFPLAIILGVACYRSDERAWLYSLPLTGIGWLIALYHSLLYAGLIPERLEPCGAGPSCVDEDMDIVGVPIPFLSVVAFSVIGVLLVFARRRIRA